MTIEVEMFSTSTCPRCEILSDYLTKKGIKINKRVVDTDLDAETDALVLHIESAPTLKKGDELLNTGDIFIKNNIDKKKVDEFIGVT